MLLKSVAMLLMLGTAGLLGGCGTPSLSQQMSVGEVDALQLRGFMPEALRSQLELGEVSGGATTSFFWGSKISSLALEQALEDSLRSVGLWSMSPQAGRYQLRAELLGLEQPLFSLDTKVMVTVHFSLVDKASGQTLYRRSVRGVHTADFGQAWISQPERLRLANEGALRQAIQLMLRDLPNVRL